MSDSIFLIKGEGENLSLNKISSKSYIKEHEMQKLIADFPELLSGDQIDSANPRRWLLLGREVGIPAQEGASDQWSIDVVLLDQDGVLTLVEVKLDANYDIRRKVTGQLLEYAAHAVDNWNLETLIVHFEKTWNKRGEDSAAILNAFLQGEGESDAATFWDQVKTNLKAGKIRLIFVADKLPDALKRVITFLNRQMIPAEVYGVEIPQFTTEDDKNRTVISRVTGQLERPVNPTSTRVIWNEESLLERLQETGGSDAVELASKIMEWAKAKEKIRIRWGTGSANGAFVPKVKNRQGKERQIFTLYTSDGGRVEFYFSGGYYDATPPFNTVAKRSELASRLNSLLERKLPEAETQKGFVLRLAIFKDESKLKGFFEIMEWVIEEVSNYPGEGTEIESGETSEDLA